MAISIAGTYGNANPASPEYPGGSCKNASSAVANDGTPLDQAWANDQQGFFQGLLLAAGMAPNGQVDTALVSQYRDAMEALMWTPGDFKPAGYSTPGRRWLECAGGSIGDAASGATARANADTLALFTKLWGEAGYAIQTSAGAASVRGASAAADWAAHKRIVLPDTRAGVPIGWDHGRGIDTGRVLGSEKAGQVGAHTHPDNNDGTDLFFNPGGTSIVISVGGDGAGAGNTGSNAPAGTENMVRGWAVMWCIRY